LGFSPRAPYHLVEEKIPMRASPTLVFASQRRAMRRAIRFECQVVRERDFRLVGKQAIDLSPDGMLVRSDDRVLTGDDVIISFRLPTTRQWFDTEGTVARVVHGRRPSDRGPCLGIEFDSLDEISRWIIRASLRGLPPPLPSRERRVDYAASVHLAALD
jgi:hypothetical protein